DYLLRVIENALRALRPGGHMFIGDLRSLALEQAFHASVVLAQSPDGRPRYEIERLTRERMAREEELAIEPQLFVELEQRMAGIAAVEIMLKDGRARNELTKFRYDVVLRAGSSRVARAPIDWIEGREVLTADDVGEILQRHPGAV